MKMKWAMMERNNAMACVGDGNRLAITNGTTLDPSLVTEGIALDASLIAKESIVDSNTSSKQLDESSCSGNDADAETILADSDASDTVDIRPSYDSDTTSEVHHDTFENVLQIRHKVMNNLTLFPTHVVNDNNSDIISHIPDMDPNKDNEGHDYVGNEKRHVLCASFVNHEAQKANAFLTKEIERYKEKQNHFAKDKTN
ncbi:hypothetical protein Tco_1301080 [Tanacetum coccineum]